MILFINACVRQESRTRRLTGNLLGRLDEPMEEVRLEEIGFPTVDEAFLNHRDQLLLSGEYDASMFALARQFAEAEKIVIAAPYWDLSFPAALKQYLEQINVIGITFRYTPEGFPQGLCKAKALYYVTTAGGMYVPDEFGFGYVKALAQAFYGIEDVRKIQAVGLDIDGADPKRIIQEALGRLNEQAIS